MFRSGDGINQPDTTLYCVSWPTSRYNLWCPYTYVWWQQPPSSGWHLPTSSQGYDWWYKWGIGWWCRNVVSKIKMLLNKEHILPHIQKESSQENHQAAAIPWSIVQLCSLLCCPLWAKLCCWSGNGFATQPQSQYTSARHWYLRLWIAYWH